MNTDFRLEIIYLFYEDKMKFIWAMNYVSQHYQNERIEASVEGLHMISS